MKVVRIIGLVCTYICMILLALMALLMVSDVLARTIFHSPIQGASEWAQVMLVSCMTSLGASIMTGSMVDIDMLTKRFKPKAQLILEIVVLIASLIMVCLIAYQQFIQGMASMKRNVIWTAISFPQWPFLFLFGVSYAVAALVIIVTIIRKIIVLSGKGNIEAENKLGSVDFEFAFGKYGMSIIGSLTKKKEEEAKAVPISEEAGAAPLTEEVKEEEIHE